jgi:hypothetical protein
MSEPIKPLRPVQAQTPGRGTADEQERGVEHQRTWVLRKGSREERRGTERRQEERRQKERRSGERRSDDRRQGLRLSEERRSDDRRKSDRRDGDRRSTERRSAAPLAQAQEPPKAAAATPEPESPVKPRRGRIDDYA